MRAAILGLIVFVTACGGTASVPSSPSPTPTPTPQTFTGRVTDTVSGSPVTGYTATISGSVVSLTAPGYEPRQTRASAAVVDLIPASAPFDLDFYRQLARNALDEGTPDVIRVLPAAPSIYLQTTGLDSNTVAAMEAAIRTAMPAFTGNKFQVGLLETGTDARSAQGGWWTIETDASGTAGQCAYTESIGASAGHTHLYVNNGPCKWSVVIAHELGHALGFGHVSRTDCLMNLGATRLASVTQPCDAERYHGAIAYHRSAGNRDIDVDQ